MSGPDDSLMLSILKELRSETRELRVMLLLLVDASRRHDRRFNELEHRFRDLGGELELMLRAN